MLDQALNFLVEYRSPIALFGSIVMMGFVGFLVVGRKPKLKEMPRPNRSPYDKDTYRR